MTPRIHLSSTAQKDVAAAKEWYADQNVPGLDLLFQGELEHVFRQVERFPAGFPVVHRDLRRANLHRFPYAVFFHPRGDKLYVVAVIHHARHPRVWQRRR
ncbi:MAG: type II toxin-antitoxin system RelE/ParE family toxin [Acidobacteria bacterium]|nr:type II toxin-antitoxin system RelE/ParE family toxin [Acidobacteriota bacterium]